MKCKLQHEGICCMLMLLAVQLISANSCAQQIVATKSNTNLIKPDYTNTVIPPNIAPLNFVILQKADRYFVKIHSKNSEPINITSRNAKIKIPPKKWKTLLDANKGNKLIIDIRLKDAKGALTSYPEITNIIAREPIDPFVAYRLMNTMFNHYENIGIYQYNLETASQSEIIHGKSFGNGCVNCHNFSNNDPEKMALAVRSGKYGTATMIVDREKISKIDKLGHTTWHPSKRAIAYSVFDVKQFFHVARSEVRDFIELDSALGYYLFETQQSKTTPDLADKTQLETLPTFSWNGEFLYYSSAPMPWTDKTELPPKNYDKVQYSILRMSYDIQTDTWGKPETLLSPEQTGVSMLSPRPSPDGRFVVFAGCKYGCTPIVQPDSDLYILELETGKYRKLEQINTDMAESWHCFSTNGRWLVFSSKRPQGVLTRLYFTYLDQDGNARKPFILPQKDPTFYDSLIKIYNVPEFITGPVTVKQKDLARAIRSQKKIPLDLAITSATPTNESQYPDQ